MNIVYRKVFNIINHQVSENQTHNIIFIPVSIYVFFFLNFDFKHWQVCGENMNSHTWFWVMKMQQLA